jgi:predicted dehydrogenase
MNPPPLSRRRFAATTVLATGTILASRLRARAQKSPGDTVVLGLIGAGGRGTAHALGFAALENVRLKHVCDVHAARAATTAKQLTDAGRPAPELVADFRRLLDDKELDAVVVATPEHWHALATVWACQAGKDVYVEKNPSLTVWEGRRMIEAARKYRRVVQVGFQNRSAPYAVTARDYLRGGKLGKVVLVKVYNLLQGGPWNPDLTPRPAPPGLDWDRWLGPAPEVPYSTGRASWYDWWDYCGGAYSGDASHQLDLARMVLGDPPPPRSILCLGGNQAFGSKRETPELQVATYEFADFTLTCDSGTATNMMRKSNHDERYGTRWPHWPSNNERIEIYGTKQLMILGRHGVGWQVFETDGRLVAEDKGVHPDKWHQPNFVACIRSREKPSADIEQAHQSANLVHHANTSFRVGGRQLLFDPVAERYTNLEAANAFLEPAYRKEYRVPDVV